MCINKIILNKGMTRELNISKIIKYNNFVMTIQFTTGLICKILENGFNSSCKKEVSPKVR